MIRTRSRPSYVVRAIAALILSSVPAPTSAWSDESGGAPAPRLISNVHLSQWTAYATGLATRVNQTGIGFSVTGAPGAAQILIHTPGTATPSTCSGILAGPSTLLTAAHCFCPYSASVPKEGYAAYCQELAARSETYVISPLAGIMGPLEDIRIHPDYFHPAKAGEEPAAFADLAAITLPALPAAPAVLSEGPVQGQNIVSVTFGHFAFASDTPAVPVTAGVPYRPGLQHFTGYGRAGEGPACSPGGKQLDAICVRFDAQPGWARDDTGSVCTGDSGGPLMIRRDGEALALAGIASYVWPASTGPNCNPEQTTVGVYTDIRPHIAWIRSITAQAAARSEEGSPPDLRSCRETILRPGRFMTEDLFRYAYVSASAPLWAAPPVTAADLGEAGHCRSPPGSGAVVCMAPEPARFAVTTPPDSVTQLTLCK